MIMEVFMDVDKKNLYEKFFDIAECWNLKQSDICKILGVHRSSLSRIHQKKEFNLGVKQQEIALLVRRIYNYLEKYLEDDYHIRKWMTNFHAYDDFRGTPMELIKNVDGLGTVLTFLKRYHDSYKYYDDLMAIDNIDYNGDGLEPLLPEE